MAYKWRIELFIMSDLYFQNTRNSVVRYRATGSEAAMQYFQVHESTGEVSVKRSLLTDPNLALEYEVSTFYDS
jgi:hypothetical protein